MINAIFLAFYHAGVAIEHGVGDIEDDDAGDVVAVDGWLVWPVGEV